MPFFFRFSVLLCVTLLTACTPSSDAPAQDALASPSYARVVSFSPALTELLFAADAGDAVVGVTTFCTWPPQARTRTQVGGIANPHFEMLRAVEPDVVFLQGEMAELVAFCIRYGIPYHTFPLETYDDIYTTLEALGSLVGDPATARAAQKDMGRAWTELAHIPADTRVPAFISVWREDGPVAAAMTVTAGSFLDDILVHVGGSNVCHDVRGAYPTVSSEVLRARRPRVIFDLQPDRIFTPETYARRKEEWARIFSADAQPEIVLLTNAFVMVPGPRVVETATIMRHALIPYLEESTNE